MWPFLALSLVKRFFYSRLLFFNQLLDQGGNCGLSSGGELGVLGESFRQLLQRMEQSRFYLRMAVETSLPISWLSWPLGEMNRDGQDSGVGSGEETQTELWVEKFRPKSYTFGRGQSTTNILLKSIYKNPNPPSFSVTIWDEQNSWFGSSCATSWFSTRRGKWNRNRRKTRPSLPFYQR